MYLLYRSGFHLELAITPTADLTDINAEIDIGQGKNSFQEKHPELRGDQKALYKNPLSSGRTFVHSSFEKSSHTPFFKKSLDFLPPSQDGVPLGLQE